MLVGVEGPPTAARTVRHRRVDCPWRHERVSLGDCRRCARLVAFEHRAGVLTVHCQCPQSDAVNDPAWCHGV